MHHRLSAFLLGVVLVLSGCASFPAAQPGLHFDDALSAEEIFARCLATHGGDLRDFPGDINLSTSGRWHALIQKIQPVVSDATFRVTSEERYRPSDQLYAVHHAGPAGTKQVVRSRDGITVYYNGVRETDPVKLRATAMTNDAFRMFHFGPSFVKARASAMSRLADVKESGLLYHRLLATLQPGFGESQTDQVVLWIDASTSRLFRVHMTLNGFETTQGAHVDTTFLAYRQVGAFLLPTRFFERVLGPIRIGAHEWHTTGIDLDRGWTREDVSGPAFTGSAATAATPVAVP